MTCTRPQAKRQILLATRASSTHGRQVLLPLIYVKVKQLLALRLGLAALEAARVTFASAMRRMTMQQRKGLSTKSVTVAGIAASILLGLAGATLTPAPAEAVIYCTYVGYPVGCVARAGVVLRPRPVARAAVRGATAGPGNWNGGVNRVGVRR